MYRLYFHSTYKFCLVGGHNEGGGIGLLKVEDCPFHRTHGTRQGQGGISIDLHRHFIAPIAPVIKRCLTVIVRMTL